LARFGNWEALLKVPRPASQDDFLVDRALWHFTRGLALVSRQDPDAAATELEGLAALAEGGEARELDSAVFPVSGTLAVARHWLAGRVAEAQGDAGAMIRHLDEAVAAEDALPYMEPTFWPLPVRPALGAALLRTGEAVRAEAVFREDLARVPRNAWGLLGLEQSLSAQSKTESADLVRRQFKAAWARADTGLDLAWF